MTHVQQDSWITLLGFMSAEYQKKVLAQVLRSRKRVYTFAINGHTQVVSRDLVRNYLKDKFPEVKAAPPKHS